jgi:hypothetical protein
MKRALLGAAAVAVALFIVGGAAATTPQATGLSVSSSFGNGIPSANVRCGIAPTPPCSTMGYTNPAVQVRWGDPVTSGFNSGLGFAPQAPPTVPVGQNFVIGQLTHFNFATVAGTSLSSADLNLTVHATTPDGPVTFTLHQTIGINETPNLATPADCDQSIQPIASPCPDELILPAGGASDSVALGSNHTYTLTVLGYTANPLSTTPQSVLVTQENQANQGYLVAALSRNNTAPAAGPDSGSTVSGGSTTIGVLGNDSDAEHDALTPQVATPPHGGTATVNPDGTITYAADSGFAGTDTFTYVDFDGFAFSSPATVTVTVTDTTDPTITVPSGPVVGEATGPDGGPVTYTATASDNATGATLDCEPPSGSTFSIGTTTVHCTATDGAGNTSTASFDVVVKDTTAPTLSGIPSNQTAEASGPGGATVTYTLPTASDAVDPHPHVDCVPASGSTFSVGTTTVSCTATDAAGNTSDPQTFTVTVTDSTPPTVTVPANTTVFSPTGTAVTVTFGASAIDLVDGTITPTCTPASGSSFAVGTTHVVCTATDAAGNTGSASFDVTVIANRPPVCSAVRVNGVSGLWPVNHKLVLVTLAGASDPDNNSISYRIDGVTQDERVTGGGSGSTAFDAQRASGGSVWLRSERDGSGDGRVYTIAFTVTDQYGLSCSSTVDVAVQHDTAHAAVKSPSSHNSFG